ncbi:MAG: sodium:solute symporter family protein [Ignavibacteriales bacterium]|nr:sodium:solute symporter family protein [Ignavibacteriales bacterium]MCB9260206.1 sodium:solute symporter family protein [Ignavibacteriales bacterium]
MISFSTLDLFIIIAFFVLVILIGLLASLKNKNSEDDYLLSGRKVGIFLFVLTNVATWYGGILGVGEFSFRYGIVSWITQGFPYYIFAILFAIFFAGKIRSASLFTIPDKLEEIYGTKVSLASAILIFILVSPAPYLLILGQIISLIFNIDYLLALLISSLVSSVYLFKGGYKSNIFADAFSFLVMFLGFIIIVTVSFNNYGGIDFLGQNLPENHLNISGGTSSIFILVWFLIALWTFTDPGFHQRCYSAKSEKVAKWGIIISVFFWLIFDFLTNTTGLYSKAILPDLENPVLAYPYLAEEILSSGLKGLFFAALIATVLSTLNSFIFLSATTFSRDFIYRLSRKSSVKNIIHAERSRSIEKRESLENNVPFTNVSNENSESTNRNNYLNYSLIYYTKIGIILTLIISISVAYYFESVVQLWYTIGSICIPGIILLVISSYYEKLRINNKVALYEIIFGVSASIIWFLIRDNFELSSTLYEIEPMIVGLLTAVFIHLVGIILRKK